MPYFFHFFIFIFSLEINTRNDFGVCETMRQEMG